MSKEFVEKRVGSASIAKAVRQQTDLSYFTQSSIQEPVTQAYIEQWANRKYAGSDQFLNYIKTIFGEKTFLSFYKYLRYPVPSAKIVNSKIRPQLERVFFSEDSFFKYTIKGQQVETPESLDSVKFSEDMLSAMMYRHNDILITDLEDVNKPFRDLVSIENVVALRSSKSVIHQIAYSASVSIKKEDDRIEVMNGFIYMDDKDYIFYDKDFNPVLTIPHDLGECPADYITPEAFSDDDIVRRSLFSDTRPDLEEYSFLRTIERMTTPNGTIPTTAILKFKNKGTDGEDIDDNGDDKQPNLPMSVSGQQAKLQTEVVGKQTEIQVGSVYDITARMKDDGSIDTNAVQNHIKFFYMPVDAIKELREKLVTLENDIIQSVTGDFKEQNETAMNEKQVSKGFTTKEDSLRKVSKGLSRIRKRSDFKMLALEFGRDAVTNEAFYGSDFFPESQDELYALYEKAPNPIERTNTQIRIIENKNRFNPDKKKEQIILLRLIPYASDIDYKSALESQAVTPENIQYQTRFPYWISHFETTYGDLLVFWEGLGDASDAEKLTIINNLILQEVKPAIVLPPPVEEQQT